MSHKTAENIIDSGTATDPNPAESFAVVKTREFAGFLPPISNTTYTPNQFFDVCLPHCSRSAIRLVGYFIRRTLGWCDQYGRPQEDQIEISFRELAEKSGVNRDGLRAALDEAIAENFLECLREGRPNLAHEAGQSAIYRLRWQEVPEYHKDPALFRGFFERDGNRTDIPNQYFDHIVPTEPLSVIKVVGVIIRSSIGFAVRRGVRRQWASLSYSQIQNFTRMGSRSQLASAIETALARHYIVRLERGNFTHETAEQRSAVYALRWADGWSGDPNGRKSSPGETAPERSEILTSNGRKSSPGERSEILTSIKTKLINEKEEKQQQAAGSPAFEILQKEGFSKETARELAASVPLEVIRQQIEWLPNRAPARSRLGMLRTAIEANWPEPKVRTSGLFEPSPAAELVRYFYAGYHGNEGAPVAEPSQAECALAESIATRLLNTGGIPEDFPRWGRRLGRMAADQPNPMPSFAIALRQLGDRLCADAEQWLRNHKALRAAQARTEHRNRWMPSYVSYLATQEVLMHRSQPEEHARFESKRAEQRRQIPGNKSIWTAAALEQFDSKSSRIEDFRRFFTLPDYDQWEAENHPYSPNKSS